MMKYSEGIMRGKNNLSQWNYLFNINAMKDHETPRKWVIFLLLRKGSDVRIVSGTPIKARV